MIRVVGVNPALDHVALWPGLRVGGVNRCGHVHLMAGGKSLNLARAVRALGEDAAAYGFLGGRTGETIREMVEEHGIVDRHQRIAGETRTCFVVVDPASGQTTMLNEPGPQVTPGEMARLLDALRDDCEPGDIVILAGSLPDSADPAAAGEIAAIGNEAGARTVVDIHGQALREAINRGPWMVKCNRDELAGLVGDDAADATSLQRYRARPYDSLAADMARVRADGVEVVVVTLGAEGALIADGDGCVHVRVPRVTAVNATGCGDVFLAGLVVALQRRERPRNAILLGAACGTAAATLLPAELPPGFDATAWTSRIVVEAIDVGA